MSYFNQHSFVLVAVLVLGIVTIVLFRDGLRGRDLVVLAAVASAFGLSWLLIRPGPSTLAAVADVDAARESGKPTLLEFQSEY